MRLPLDVIGISSLSRGCCLLICSSLLSSFLYYVGVSEFNASELEASGVSLASSSSSSVVGWDPMSQLWKRFKIAVVAVSTVLQI